MSHFEPISVFANLFRGIEGVGGKLQIDHNGLHFRPHAINIQKNPLDIEFENIQSTKLVQTLFLVPNGLKVILKSGEKHHFVVWNRKKLKILIDSQIV